MRPFATVNRKSDRGNRKEIALASLLAHSTIAEAASTSRISRATLYRFLADESFQILYRQAKHRVLDDAIIMLKSAALKSVQVLIEVANDSQSPSSSRVAAANSLLNAALRAKQIEDVEERLDRIEAVPSLLGES